MHFFSPSQLPWAHSKPPQDLALRAHEAGSPMGAGGVRKIDCGWYDSSFDLAQGLEVDEQHCDTLYQLWELSLR